LGGTPTKPAVMLVRSVVRSDFDRWLPLWDGYNRFYGLPELPMTITQTTWARFFDAGEPTYALVAEEGAELLGLAHYLFHRSTWSIEPVCYLRDLFTAEGARGRGVGRALIETVYERAREAGLTRVYWQTHESNQVARALYDRVAELSGFIVYEKQV
jgi:GNAT superfamily N-acetyltransferase